MTSIALVVVVIMAAFVADLGMAYSVRRQAQSSADSAVLGGSMDLHLGPSAFTERAASIARTNLEQTYTDAEWRALWAQCTDSEALPLRGTVLGESTECISADVLGRTRVRVPNQQVATAFASVVGMDTMLVNAAAESSLRIPGVGGVLPFAVLASAESGSSLCLRSSTAGQASPPCTGSDSGNFGALESPQYGNPDMGTVGLPCNLNKTDQVAVNISVGIDHYVREHTGNDILDSCSKPFGPTMLNTFQGISGGLWEGMVGGAFVVDRTFPGRLTLGDGPTRVVRQNSTDHHVDDQPIWEFISPGRAGPTSTFPQACARETFDDLPQGQRTAQVSTCMEAYIASGTTEPLFDLDADGDGDLDIFSTSRFGIVPQFQESSFPSGNGYLRLSGFRAVYIHGLYFGCSGGGTCSHVLHPGEGDSGITVPNGSSPLDQVTAILLPEHAVGPDLLSGGQTGMGPYQTSLSR